MATMKNLLSAMIDKINATPKTVNGIAPDVNGNIKIEVGTGTGGVSSWNDLTDKPFGEETGVIFEETSLIIDENGVNNLDIEIPLVAGEMYRVTWNGEVYNCVAKTVTSDGATIVFIGNPDGSSNEPFSVASYPKELWESTLCKATIMTTTPSITVPICIEGKVIKTLDPKYLPSGAGGGFDPYYVEIQVTGTDTPPIVDKTYDDIIGAVNEGKQVIAKAHITSSDTTFLPLSCCDLANELCEFEGFFRMGGLMYVIFKIYKEEGAGIEIMQVSVTS